MENNKGEKRKGCNRSVVLFFIFAIVIIGAFLIIGLVRTCESDHQETENESISLIEHINFQELG